MSPSEQKDETRVAAGLKATVHNPRTSDEAKERATERLHEMGTDPEETSSNTRKVSREESTEAVEDQREEQPEEIPETINGKDAGNVLRGYKATLSNPRVSEEAKQHAEEVLEQYGQI